MYDTQTKLLKKLKLISRPLLEFNTLCMGTSCVFDRKNHRVEIMQIFDSTNITHQHWILFDTTKIDWQVVFLTISLLTWMYSVANCTFTHFSFGQNCENHTTPRLFVLNYIFFVYTHSKDDIILRQETERHKPKSKKKKICLLEEYITIIQARLNEKWAHDVNEWMYNMGYMGNETRTE